MDYLVVAGAAAADFFFLLCFLVVAFAGAALSVAALSAAIGAAADFGMSAAMAAVAIPADNKAEAINLIMESPAVGWTSTFDERSKNTPERRCRPEMKIISRTS